MKTTKFVVEAARTSSREIGAGHIDHENEPVLATPAPKEELLQARARTRIRWLVMGTGVLLCWLCFLVALTYVNFNRLSGANDWSVHSYRVINQSSHLRNSIENLERRLRGFALTNDASYYVPRFRNDQVQAKAALRELRALTRDRPEQLQRLNNIGRDFGAWNQRYITREEDKTAGNMALFARRIALGTTARRQGLDELQNQLDAFDLTERHLLAAREREQKSARSETARTLLFASFFTIALSGALTLLLSRSAQSVEISNARLRLENAERLRIEERFRHLAEDSLDLICRHDAKGAFTYVSPAVRPLLGYWPDELVGRHPFEIIHPDELNLREKSGQLPFGKFLKGGRNAILYRFRHRQGHYVWLEIVGHAILDPDTNETREWQTTARDVTARVQDEEKRRRMLEGLRAVLQVADELIETQPEDEAALLRRAVTAARDYLGCGPCSLWLMNGKSEVIGAFEARAQGPARSLDDTRPDEVKARIYLDKFATSWHGARWKRVESDPLGSLEGPVAITPLWGEGGVIATLHNQFETDESDAHSGNARQELVAVFCSLLGTLMDRSRAETRYRSSEVRYRRVVQTLKEGIFQTDAQGVFTFLNPAWSEISGFSVPESLGRAHLDFVHAEDRSRWQEAFGALSEGRENQIRLVVRYQTRAGQVRWLELFGQRALGRQNEFAGMTGTLNDVTERLLTQNALHETLETQRAILESAAYAIIATDAQGIVRVFNPAAEAMLERSALSVVGQPFPLDIFDAAQLEARARELSIEYGFQIAPDLEVLTVPARNKGGHEREWTLRHAQNGTFPARLSCAPLRGEDGATTGYVSIVYDLTDSQRAERLKNEFVSVVSHELRTPLTSIRGSLGLLSGGVAGQLPPAAGDMLQIALKNAERLNVLINDILDIEKIENGQMGFQMNSLALPQLIETSCEQNRSYGETLGVELELEPLPIELQNGRVLGDESRLQQVFSNLISNACKWTPRGEVVAVRARQQGAHVVRFEVQDAGPGVPPEFVPRLFERFAQADSSATRKLGGTGLGLAIARVIVQRHGGVIGYLPPDEASGRNGATFYFDLTLEKN